MLRRRSRRCLFGSPFIFCLLLTPPAFARPADSSLTVGSIVITGNATTKAEVILREMTLAPGAALTSGAISVDQERVYNLRLFNRVTIVPVDTVGARVTLRVDVDERWYIFPLPIIGFRHRDVRNLYYGLGVTHRNFNGLNQRITISAGAGYERWVGARYEDPRFAGEEDLIVSVAGGYSETKNLAVSFGEYEQETISAEVTVGKRLDLYRRIEPWVGVVRLSVSEPRIGRTLSPAGTDTYLEGGVRYSSDKRNLAEYTTHGTLMLVGVDKFGFGESQVNQFRLWSDSRMFVELYDEAGAGMRLLGAFRGGGVTPPYLYELFGYGNRVRGHFYSKVEGENILLTSIEARIPILKPFIVEFPRIPIQEFRVHRYGLYAAVFADAGTLWFRSADDPGKQWRTGAGAGLHFLLPYSVVARVEGAVNGAGRAELVLDIESSF